MARAKIVGTMYFGAALVRTRAAPEPHQVRTEEFMNEAAPAPTKGHTIQLCWKRRWRHCIWACSVTMTVIPYLAELMNGSL